jgi:hypothetical protein
MKVPGGVALCICGPLVSHYTVHAGVCCTRLSDYSVKRHVRRHPMTCGLSTTIRPDLLLGFCFMRSAWRRLLGETIHNSATPGLIV